MVRLKADVLVVAGGEAALVAKGASSTIPIVMTAASDPVALGVVASLARPEGNVTGLSALATELNTKRLEVLKAGNTHSEENVGETKSNQKRAQY